MTGCDGTTEWNGSMARLAVAHFLCVVLQKVRGEANTKRLNSYILGHGAGLDPSGPSTCRA